MDEFDYEETCSDTLSFFKEWEIKRYLMFGFKQVAFNLQFIDD